MSYLQFFVGTHCTSTRLGDHIRDDLARPLDRGGLRVRPVLQGRSTTGYHSPTVVSTNYLVVGASLMIYLAATEQLIVPIGALVTGLVTGSVFVSSLVLMTRMLERAPVGAVFTAFRMSIVVPVVFGVLLWQEPLAPGQMAGISLAILALVMMTSGMDATRHITGWKIVGLLLAVFLLQGLSHSCLRSVHYNGLDDSFVQIVMVTGARPCAGLDWYRAFSTPASSWRAPVRCFHRCLQYSRAVFHLDRAQQTARDVVLSGRRLQRCAAGQRDRPLLLARTTESNGGCRSRSGCAGGLPGGVGKSSHQRAYEGSHEGSLRARVEKSLWVQDNGRVLDYARTDAAFPIPTVT